MKTPSFSKEQVEYLNTLWPEKCPEKSHSERDIWCYVGSRHVVRHINALFEAQVERSMQGTKK
jgi:hypothetical protein